MSLPVVLFIDEVTPRPYDPHTLATQAMGGTESSVVRVAEGLAATRLFNVQVAQHNREVDYVDGAQYLPNIDDSLEKPDYVISLRSPDTLRRAKERFPNAKHYLWAHDLASVEWARDLLPYRDFTTVAVSNFHKTQIQQALYPQGYSGQFPVKVIYNPIDDSLAPDSMPVDPNKLVFFSSPHKGLEYTLEIFKNLRSFNPRFRLAVANPGYLATPVLNMDGVDVLGPLPHDRAISEVRKALCVFYPNVVFQETFGLVFAESNAVGTPVLTHPIGASREVLFHPSETLDCRNPRSVIDRVMAWHSGNRPRVKANPKFRLSAVISAWRRLLGV